MIYLGVGVDTDVDSGHDGDEDGDQPDQLAVEAGLGEVAETMQSRLLAVQNA